MNEPGIDLADAPPSGDGTSMPPVPPEDHLATTRLPALAPPPRPSRRTSQPTVPPFAEPKHSWWRALLASTIGPPSPGITAGDARTVDLRIAAICAGAALVLFLVALGVGLAGAPSQAPAIAVAVVAARSVFALGLLGVAFSILRMAERFFTRRSEQDAQDARPAR